MARLPLQKRYIGQLKVKLPVTDSAAFISKLDSKTISDFMVAYDSGRVCIHPTDTLPGISLNPLSDNFREKIAVLKSGRKLDKAPVCLTASLEKATLFWQQLPTNWCALLKEVWPAPLTVVHTASESVPTSLLHPQNESRTIAIRIPAAIPRWLQVVLDQLPLPLPSTSINQSGKPPIVDWSEASAFVDSFEDTYVPKLTQDQKVSLGQQKPSTIIQIISDSSYKIIRPGAFELNKTQFENKNLREEV